MWAWPYTESVLRQNRKHHIWVRAKATVSPTLCHQLGLVSPWVQFTCRLIAQRNTGMSIHSYPIKSERHHLRCPGHEPSLTSCSWVSWSTHASTPCDAWAARSRAGVFQQGPAQPNHLPTCAPNSIYNQNTAPQWQALPFKTWNTFSTEMNSSVRCFSVLSPAKSDLQMLPLLTEEVKKKSFRAVLLNIQILLGQGKTSTSHLKS